MRFGKPLTQYAGMTEMLQDLQDGARGIRAIEVVDAGGEPLYAVQDGLGALASSVRNGADQALDDDRSARRAFDLKALAENDAGREKLFWAGPQSYRIVVALQHKGIVGGVALEIDATHVEASSTGFVRWAMALLAAACVAVCVILAAWIGLLTGTPE